MVTRSLTDSVDLLLVALIMMKAKGYDEQGFKIVSRDVLESNIEKIVSELDFKIPDSAKSKKHSDRL